MTLSPATAIYLLFMTRKEYGLFSVAGFQVIKIIYGQKIACLLDINQRCFADSQHHWLGKYNQAWPS